MSERTKAIIYMVILILAVGVLVTVFPGPHIPSSGDPRVTGLPE